MTPEQAAAYIIAQAACANAEIAAMQARDKVAERTGTTPHAPQEYEDVILRYGIHHNAVCLFFQ